MAYILLAAFIAIGLWLLMQVATIADEQSKDRGKYER